MKKTNIITEDLSRSLKDLLKKTAEKMSEQLDISLEEAMFVTGLYGEIKDKGLFTAAYMRDISLEADDGEKTPDITNIQQMAGYPELIYDIIKYVLLESSDFNENYDIIFSDDFDVKIKKKEKKPEKKRPDFSTPWDKYKVAEDRNWVTFYLPSFDPNLKNFYAKMYPDDRRINKANKISFFQTNWCVLSDPSRFNDQKGHDQRNKWFFTFSKHNPIDEIINFLNTSSIHGLDEDEIKVAIEELNDPNSANSLSGTVFPSNISKIIRDNVLGECFLLHHDPSTKIPTGNFGYHLYSNSPGSAVAESDLYNAKTYDYINLRSSDEPFTIENGVLLSYNDNDDVVQVPNGVVKIGKNAFLSRRCKEVILPVSTTTILDGAFINCTNLSIVSVTNSLSFIQRNAFDKETAKNDIMLGVFIEQQNGSYILKKPRSLTAYPKGIFNKNINISGKEQMESKKPIVNTEAVRLLNKPLYDYEDERFIIEHNIFEFKPEITGRKFGNLVIPEGVTYLRSKIYGSYESITFPSTFAGWPENTEPLIDSPRINTIGILDFSKVTKVRIIEDRKFYYAIIDKILLPQSIVGIGHWAFFLSSVKEMYIPSSVKEIDEKAFQSTNIKAIITDSVDKLKPILEKAKFRTMPELIQV